MGGFLIVYMTDFSHGTASEQAPIDFSRLFRYGSTQEGIAALSYNPANPDLLPRIANQGDNLCLFVGITLSLSEDQRFAWIGGKDTAMCPSECFLRITGDKRRPVGLILTCTDI